MKIVHLIWGLEVGGAETLLVDIANAQARDHQVWLVIGNSDVDPAILEGLGQAVRTIRIGRRPGSRNPWCTLRLLAALWRIGPDVIHAHQESFIRLKKLMPAPLVLTVHSSRGPFSPELSRFDAVCCISEAVRAEVGASLPGCRTHVVHNGVDFAALGRKLSYGGNPFRVVQVSRLDHETKGQDLLIRALRVVHDLLGEESVTVDFIGEGASRGYLERLTAGCNLREHCRFLGKLSRQEVYARLGGYDLLVQPSRSEGFGLTVVEGIAAGLPVLVSDIEGPLEIIAGGKLGRCFRSEDVVDLAANLVACIREARTAGFATLIRERQELAAQRFDISRTARRYLEIYRGLLPGARHSGAAPT